MKMLMLPLIVVLATSAGTAMAQSATSSTPSESSQVKVAPAAPMTAAEKSAESFCLRETGTHLHAIVKVKSHSESAVQCARDPGRSYSREDIARTGEINTADALRKLDPSIR